MAEDRGPELAAVLGLFLGLSLVFVLLRVYVKTFLSKSWGSDDILLVLSLIFFTTYCACSATGVNYGTGRHATDIPPNDIPKALYYWFLCEIFYAITTLFIRLSIAVFLLRICVKPLHKNIVYITSAAMIAFTIFYFFLVIFQCHPTSYFWGQFEGKKGSCINPAVVPNASIAHSAVSFTADWILGLLPIALIWDLKMNTRTKVSVGILMSLGLLAGVATMIRVPYIKVLALTEDFLFATTDVAIWSTVEPGLGLCAAGGATLRPLFRKFYNLSTLRSRPTRNTHHRDSHMINLDHQQLGGINSSKISSQSRTQSHTQYHAQIHSTSHSHSLSQSRFQFPFSSSSSSSPPDNEIIYLRSDTIDTFRSPFGDSRENVKDSDSHNNSRSQDERKKSESSKMGGIKIEQTVEISRVENHEDLESDGGSLKSVERPRTAKSSWDLV
ncbi:hypothetical protein ONS96_011977 [Cadophora gregata f. sp. sojae]|nr:hypothetical protein ONS96_011977 [Cadophora gregata f. sp. sojae]